MAYYWRTPGGQCSGLYEDMARQPHLLIAGATGSGKSVVINGIIYSLLACNSPAKVQFILLDPKRVELVQYKALPHTICYASEPDEHVQALKKAIALIEDRYRTMQKAGLRKSEDSDVYVIIDELADLMTTQKKEVMPLLQRICQIGRAANVHVIAATQCPLACILPTAIKVNFDARVGLRCRSGQDSRNILGVTGCETLPRYGFGYYMRPEGTDRLPMHYFTDEQIQDRITWWTSQSCKTTQWIA